MIDPLPLAEVLNQALPYIQTFRGQTFAIKYGGSAMRDPDVQEGVIRTTPLPQLVGINPILIHGGGPEIDKWLDRLGIAKKTSAGLRVTDDETMEVVEMALSGRANKALVAHIQKAGGKAVGLSGRDGGLLVAEPISEELGRVGQIVQVNPELLGTVADAGYVPVVCSVASDVNGDPLNVNADAAAAAIAAAIGATKLILLTDTNGLLAEKDDAGSTISSLTSTEAKQMIALGRADRGMIPKLESAVQALEDGVPAVHLINGGVANALLVEIFTQGGIGTMLKRN